MKTNPFATILMMSGLLFATGLTAQARPELSGEKIISNLDSTIGWTGVKLERDKGPDGSACALLAVPEAAVFAFDEIQQWYFRHAIQLDLSLPDQRELEVDFEVQFKMKTAEFEMRTVSAIRTVRISGAGWHHLVLPLENFQFLTTANAWSWQFVKQVTIRPRFVSGEQKGVVLLDNLGLSNGYPLVMTCERTSKPGQVGEQVNYPFRVYNNSGIEQSITLVLKKRGNEVMATHLNPESFLLVAGESKSCQLSVEVNEQVSPGGFENQRVVAIPNGQGNHSAEIRFATLRQMPHPYMLHTNDGWAGVLKKMEATPWARSVFEQQIKGSSDLIKSAIDWKLTGSTEALDRIVSFLKTLRDPIEQVHVSEGIFFTQAAILYDLVHDESVLTPDDHAHIRHSLNLFVERADPYLATRYVDNYRVCVNAATICISLVLQDMNRLQRYLFGPGGFADQIGAGVMGDGWWRETTTEYQRLVTGQYNLAAQGCYHFGYDLFRLRVPTIYLCDRISFGIEEGYHGMSFDTWGPPGENSRGLEDLYDSTIAFSNYRGVVIANNDSFEKELFGIYEQAWQHLKKPEYAWVIQQSNRQDWRSLLYGDPELPVVEDPRSENAIAANVGLAVLRSKNAGHPPEEQIMATLKWGTHGGWHGHFDRISLLSLERYGESFFVQKEAGWYSYDADQYKMWVQSSAAHNMVVVDEKQQEPVESELLLFASGKMLQAAAAQTKARWAQVPDWLSYFPKKEDGNTPELNGVFYDSSNPILQRRLIAVAEDYLVIADYLSSDQQRTFDWLIHPRGFRRLKAAGKTFVKHTARLSEEPISSYKYVTDCDWYEIKTPLQADFQDNALNTRIWMVWPQAVEVMIGTYPKDSREFWYLNSMTFTVKGDGKPLTSDSFSPKIYETRQIDIPLKGIDKLSIEIAKKGRTDEIYGVALGDPRVITGEGRTVYLSDLNPMFSHMHKQVLVGQDYEGGKITISGDHYDHGLMAEPLNEGRNKSDNFDSKTGIIEVDLSGVDAVRFQAVVGVDYLTHDEKDRVRTLLARTRGDQARYLAVLEPYREESVIQNIVAASSDDLRIEFKDGRVHTLSIKNFETENPSIQLTESKGAEVIRQETLGD